MLYWSKYIAETEISTCKLRAIHGTSSLVHSTQIPNQLHPAPPLTPLPRHQQWSQCCRTLLLPLLLAPHSSPPPLALLQLHLPPLQVMVVDWERSKYVPDTVRYTRCVTCCVTWTIPSASSCNAWTSSALSTSCADESWVIQHIDEIVHLCTCSTAHTCASGKHAFHAYSTYVNDMQI